MDEPYCYFCRHLKLLPVTTVASGWRELAWMSGASDRQVRDFSQGLGSLLSPQNRGPRATSGEKGENSK
jgi:hypothetical protein